MMYKKENKEVKTNKNNNENINDNLIKYLFFIFI